jgi:glucose/arabinose dehydrogenase
MDKQRYPPDRGHQFLTELVSGLGKPWSVAVLPSDTFLISLKSGAFLYIHPDGKQTLTPAPGVVETGQGGLLDLVPAPDFGESGRIFFTFTAGSSGEPVR